jgi:phosphoglycerate kinase
MKSLARIFISNQLSNLGPLMTTIKTVNVTGRHMFVCVDLNVRLDGHGQFHNMTRVTADLLTVNYLIRPRAEIILISHLGRPGGARQNKYSFSPVAKIL